MRDTMEMPDGRRPWWRARGDDGALTEVSGEAQVGSIVVPNVMHEVSRRWRKQQWMTPSTSFCWC